MKEIDARGVSCPGPVVMARDGIREGSPFRILVSGSGQAENVKRAAERLGAAAIIHPENGFEAVEVVPSSDRAPVNDAGKNVPLLAVSVPHDSFGTGGDPELEDVLCRAYFHTLTEMTEALPSLLVFYDRGVYLAIEGSAVLDDLKLLESRGMKLLVCGTCLNHFGVAEKLGAGKVSNMFEIATELGCADRHYAI